MRLSDSAPNRFHIRGMIREYFPTLLRSLIGLAGDLYFLRLFRSQAFFGNRRSGHEASVMSAPHDWNEAQAYDGWALVGGNGLENKVAHGLTSDSKQKNKALYGVKPRHWSFTTFQPLSLTASGLPALTALLLVFDVGVELVLQAFFINVYGCGKEDSSLKIQ